MPYRSGFANCPASPTAAGLWTVPFRRFADLNQEDNQKARLNALAVLSAFFFVFTDFARSPTDAGASRRIALKALPEGCCLRQRYATPL